MSKSRTRQKHSHPRAIVHRRDRLQLEEKRADDRAAQFYHPPGSRRTVGHSHWWIQWLDGPS